LLKEAHSSEGEGGEEERRGEGVEEERSRGNYVEEEGGREEGCLK
jgi:hypothetical protein